MDYETRDKIYLEHAQRTRARNRRELAARDLMKRAYLKLHCDVHDEPDSVLAIDAMHWLADDMGPHKFNEWLGAHSPEVQGKCF